MLVEVNRLLQLKSEAAQLLSYDTTFKLGDFYVSPLLFRNILFKTNPVMPAVVMIHERKLKNTHDELMKLVANELPCLLNGSQTVPMVTDEEKVFVSIDEHKTYQKYADSYAGIMSSTQQNIGSKVMEQILQRYQYMLTTFAICYIRNQRPSMTFICAELNRVGANHSYITTCQKYIQR